MRCSALCILACGLLVLAVTEARSTSLKTYLQHLKARQVAPPPCSDETMDLEFEKCIDVAKLDISGLNTTEFEESYVPEEEPEEDEDEQDIFFIICELHELNKGEKFNKFAECFKEGECATEAEYIIQAIPHCQWALSHQKKQAEERKLVRKVLKLLAAWK